MSERNKVVMRRIIEEAWNQGNYEVIKETLSPDYVGHMIPATFPAGPEGFRQYIQMYRDAIPDLHIQIDDMLYGEGKVVSRVSVRGTHGGPMMNIPPTHKKIAITGMVITRFENGRNVEMWGEHDTFGLMQQIGVIPAE